MICPSILAYADYRLPFKLHTDASCTGLGAVLYQRQNNEDRVVAYTSRNSKPSEKNYPAHKLEFLALKWAITEKFHYYLYSTHRKECHMSVCSEEDSSQSDTDPSATVPDDTPHSTALKKHGWRKAQTADKNLQFAVYLTSLGRPTDIGLQLGKAAILVVGKGRGGCFYFFCFFIIPVPLSSLSLSFVSSTLSSISFLPFSGRRHKMTLKG